MNGDDLVLALMPALVYICNLDGVCFWVNGGECFGAWVGYYFVDVLRS